MSRNKITQEEFINKVTKLYPEYDFSKAIYKNSIEKVEVKCQHRTWYFRAGDLLYGNHGCKKCRGIYKKKNQPMSQEKFLEKATKIFPNYDFSRSIYNGAYEKVEIGCEHGYWWIKSHDLLRGHTGCKECKKLRTQKTNIEKYGSKCTLQCPEVHKKTRNTMIKKYGSEYSFNSTILQEKRRNTMLERYGVEESWMNPQTYEKQKETMMKKYGVECALQSSEIQEKRKKTCVEKYGVEYPSSLSEIKEKQKQTNIKRYGVEYLMQSSEIQEKAKETLLERYGVDNSARIKNK